ncbi:putative toxin-antitoxin system toxin component, PIN family [Polynucleobacter difficilis]|uniref:putative toxin-antitoxin system toxin component, PIN family n=1 Tax=Polynucleobacter difficilis TaxID=556054 RepID=UPI000D345AF1|nr:putative toxin-antitoxin system toxin component, PIN family [Polynucleobacter difficilis]
MTDIKPRLVLDTNVILDLLVFKDPSAEPLRLMLDAKIVDAVRSEASMLELVDVIQRPIFKLSQQEQEMILQAWESLTRLLENTAIESAPFICRDLDDQIFLDMAYSIRPAVLFSKDLRVLELRVSAKGHGVEITNQYDYLQAPSP